MSVERVGKQCVGCLSCKYICPVKAISSELNELNEWHIIVDSQKCINCKKCDAICPVITKTQLSNRVMDIYCAFAYDDITRLSSSGGIFFSIAKRMVVNGDYVCGAVYSDDFQEVRHVVSNNISIVEEMRGSKYVASNLDCVFSDLMSVLQNSNNMVVFSGTPCQCASIKSVFKQYHDRIYFVELVCNGVMAPVVLSLEIQNYRTKNNSNVLFYTMRAKKDSYFPIYSRIMFEDKTVIEKPFYDTDLGSIYGTRIVLRDCCYHCKFKGLDRFGDITIGDYHGFAVETRMRTSKYGESMVLVNNSKGKELMHILERDCDVSFYKCASRKEAISSNPRLVISGYAPGEKQRKKFKRELLKNGIASARKMTSKYYSRKYIVIRKLTDKFQFMIKKHR